MLSALKNQGVPQDYIYLIKEMYDNVRARIKTDVQSNYFNIKKGVRQGNPLSPILVISSLEQIFRNLNWENRRISINGKRIINLRGGENIELVNESTYLGQKLTFEKNIYLKKNPRLRYRYADSRI